MSETDTAPAPPPPPPPPPLQAVQSHWFFCQPADGSSSSSSHASWHPFSREDSEKLEDVYAATAGGPKTSTSTPAGGGGGSDNGEKKKGDVVVVAVEGGRYDVHLKERTRHAVYWQQTPAEVRRCTWFYKERGDARYTPYAEDFAARLEEAYAEAASTDEWKRTVREFPSGETVILDNPKLIMQYQSPGSEKTHTRAAKRGADSVPVEIPDGEPERVDHLVFMVHGIGPACDLAFRSIAQCVNDFRRVSLGLLASHYGGGRRDGTVSRVEFLPVNWHSALHGDGVGGSVDGDMLRITLPSVSRLRHFINSTLLDVFFYHSATYCQTIVDAVASEINRMHALFRQRHPEFTGEVSVAGHSLGSLILFDLLTNQTATPTEETTGGDEPSSSRPSVPEPLSPSSSSDEYFDVGVGQLPISYPQLDFRPQSFFAFGSPLGMFLRVRGVKRIHPAYAFPTCGGFYNVFHPYDPVAYRVEPIVGGAAWDQRKPVRVPHHRGNKRMHELKDSLSHMGTDLRNALGSLRTAFQSFASRRPSVVAAAAAATATASPEESEETATEEEGNVQGETNDEAAESSSPPPAAPSEETAEAQQQQQGQEVTVGMLNGGRRIDYVLQDTPFKSFTDYLFPFSEYLFATHSHLCYWESKDTALLLLREIYDKMGVAPEQPQ